MRIIVPILLVVLSGCSTKPVVTDITGAGDKAKIPGVPFRVKQQYVAHIYKLDEDKDSYTEVSTSPQLFPNLNKLYAMNFKGDWFASRSLQIGQNADNTLKSMQVTSTSNTSAILDAVNSTVSGVTAADTAKKTAALTNAKAVVDADKAVRDAQKDLDALPSTTSAETKAMYERILESAKQQAAAARSAAGR